MSMHSIVLTMVLILQERTWTVCGVPDSRGVLSKQMPSSAIFEANKQSHCTQRYSIFAVLQPTTSAKVRGAYRKMSAKKAEIGKRAAERGALATICYRCLKLPAIR